MMKSRRRRKEIRQLARKASGAQPPAPPPAFEEVSCPCGHRFRLAVGDEGKTFICPACRGGFKAARAADSVLQLFPADEVPAASLNSTAADTHAATEVVQALGAQVQSPGELDHAIEPEPPARMEFPCPCGEVLVATTKTYDKRASCARCGAKLLVNLVYSTSRKAFNIVPVRVG